ncbi:MAG: hypothetical protein Q8O29_08710 [Polaromonas sp.]|uniref:hypothetical protein n=1 Tax=Polaromonas sp. TaxID=1869339 RepID=UPI0027358AA1|nr:hypothetical protein [Polaromonas sp.]MDP2818346.1 hypothetical protein [Polaromonas sp.]
MSIDLSGYWSKVRQTKQGWAHPDDEDLLGREPHTFNLDFPPPAFVGDIENAKIIVLAANGGYSASVTPGEFAAIGAADRYLKRLSFPAEADWQEVAPYYRGINYSELVFSGKAAIVNACAYRSPKISEEPDNRRLIKKLHSAQFTRRWLIEVVLPQMQAGSRVIVGKRHGLWDLPSSIKQSNGFIADPAPVSPHFSVAVWEQLKNV